MRATTTMTEKHINLFGFSFTKSSKMKRYCAIDFDGVILRNHPVHTVVSNRCNQFVGKKLSLPNLEKAKLKNKELYSATGHTLLGLKKLGVKTSLKEFNDYVYGDMDYGALFENMHLTHQEDIDGLDTMLLACHNENVIPFIFSNAPNVFAHNVLKHMSQHPKATVQTHELINRLHASQHITKDLLKPDKDAYTAIERAYTGAAATSPRATFIFVDDSLVNLLPTLIRPNWQGVLVSAAQGAKAPLSSSTFIHTTPSLRAFAFYLQR